MKTRHLDATFEVKAVSDDGTFSGYGSVFGVVDSYNERVMPGAFTRSIEQKGASGVALLWQHRSDSPIGVYTEMREDAKGLYVEGRLALGTEKGREAYELMKMGWKAGMSIGFMPTDTEKAEDGVHEVYELDLWEVSIVTFPANAASMVEQVRAKIENGDEPTKRDIERLLTRDAGLSRSKTAALLAGGYDAMINQRDADDEVSKMWKALEGFSL